MTVQPSSPLVLPYRATAPVLHGPVAAAGAGSAILGRVTLGGGAEMGPYAVLRADGHVIEAGSGLYLGAGSTIHIAHDLHGATVGNNVTVGANAVVHACTVGDDCVIEDGAVVLDGAVVGAGCVVARGAVVFARTVLPPGQRVAGIPAVPVGPVDAAQLAALHRQIRDDGAAAAVVAPARVPDLTRSDAQGYVAATVTGQGRVQMARGSSIWFGCAVDARGGSVVIGVDSNVQDNSVLRSVHRPVTIGAACTIGHNVLLEDCTVGDRVLVGMGSVLAPGTVVGDDVLVAAGATTADGQVLAAGWLWGGRPARAIAPLDERKKQLIQRSAATYCDYARDFALSEANAGRAGAP